jgi:hypothetical protein
MVEEQAYGCQRWVLAVCEWLFPYDVHRGMFQKPFYYEVHYLHIAEKRKENRKE